MNTIVFGMNLQCTLNVRYKISKLHLYFATFMYMRNCSCNILHYLYHSMFYDRNKITNSLKRQQTAKLTWILKPKPHHLETSFWFARM